MRIPMAGFGARVAAIGLACAVALPAFAQDDPPDFTGLWTSYRGGGGGGGFGGRGGGSGGPQFTPEAQARVSAYRAAISGTNHSPGNYCVGTGMPGSMLGSGGYPMEIVQHPQQINITYEAHNEARRVYFGDRVVDSDEIFPERNGYSVGRWEGDTLIVETTHLLEQIDQTYAHSDQAKIVEEYTVETLDNGTRVLTAEMTMTDPVFLTEPFSTTKRWQEVPNGRILSYECTEPDWLEVLDELLSESGSSN